MCPRPGGHWGPRSRSWAEARTRSPPVVLTHAHFDHIGFAERARGELGVPVWVHENDVPLTRHPAQYAHERPRSYYLATHPKAMPIIASLARNRAFFPKPIAATERYEAGAVPVPGSPRAVFTAGHTLGHCALHLPERGAVLAGDAVVTLDPLAGHERAPDRLRGRPPPTARGTSAVWTRCSTPAPRPCSAATGSRGAMASNPRWRGPARPDRRRDVARTRPTRLCPPPIAGRPAPRDPQPVSSPLRGRPLRRRSRDRRAGYLQRRAPSRGHPAMAPWKIRRTCGTASI